MTRPPPISPLSPYPPLSRPLVGCVTTAEEVDPQAVRARLMRRLPSHLVPAEIVQFDRLPLNANGKLDRALLASRSEEHTSELQSRSDLVCRLLLEKKKKNKT